MIYYNHIQNAFKEYDKYVIIKAILKNKVAGNPKMKFS